MEKGPSYALRLPKDPYSPASCDPSPPLEWNVSWAGFRTPHWSAHHSSQGPTGRASQRSPRSLMGPLRRVLLEVSPHPLEALAAATPRLPSLVGVPTDPESPHRVDSTRPDDVDRCSALLLGRFPPGHVVEAEYPPRVRSALIVVERGWWDILVDPRRLSFASFRRVSPPRWAACSRIPIFTLVLDAPAAALAAAEAGAAGDPASIASATSGASSRGRDRASYSLVDASQQESVVQDGCCGRGHLSAREADGGSNGPRMDTETSMGQRHGSVDDPSRTATVSLRGPSPVPADDSQGETGLGRWLVALGKVWVLFSCCLEAMPPIARSGRHLRRTSLRVER